MNKFLSQAIKKAVSEYSPELIKTNNDKPTSSTKHPVDTNPFFNANLISSL